MNPSRRLALQYVLLFGVNGVSLPFAGLWLKAQGLNGAEIGLLLAAPMLARLITGPAIAVWADGFRLRRTPIAILGLTAGLAFAGAGVADAIWIQGALWFVAATAMAALIPLTDVLSLTAATHSGFSFAVPRGFGSASFVVTNVVMGAVLTRGSVDWIIVWIALGGGLIALNAATLLPREGVSGGPGSKTRDRLADLFRLLGDRAFLTVLIAVGAIQSTHAFYYGFSAIAWKAQGLSETMTGLLWAMSVVIEIGFLWVVEPWRRRAGISGWTLLFVGGLAAVVRWTALAFAPPLWMLWALQPLHALTFAATYLAGIEMIQAMTPPERHTAAQTLNSVMAAGVLIGLATLASGPLYDRFGTLGYFGMTALAVCGLFAAWRLRPLS